MKVTYKAITLQEVFDSVKENGERKDLFFEDESVKNPDTLRNLASYKVDLGEVTKKNWFKREIQ